MKLISEAKNSLPHLQVQNIELRFITELEKIGNDQIDLVDNMRLSALQLSKSLSRPSLNTNVKVLAENHWTLYSTVLNFTGVETMPIQGEYKGRNHRLDFLPLPNMSEVDDTRWNLHIFFTQTSTAIEHGYKAGAESFIHKIKEHYLPQAIIEIEQIREKGKFLKEKLVSDITRIFEMEKNNHDRIALTALKSYAETLTDREERKFGVLLTRVVDDVFRLILEIEK